MTTMKDGTYKLAMPSTLTCGEVTVKDGLVVSAAPFARYRYRCVEGSTDEYYVEVAGPAVEEFKS